MDVILSTGTCSEYSIALTMQVHSDDKHLFITQKINFRTQICRISISCINAYSSLPFFRTPVYSIYYSLSRFLPLPSPFLTTASTICCFSFFFSSSSPFSTADHVGVCTVHTTGAQITLLRGKRFSPPSTAVT